MGMFDGKSQKQLAQEQLEAHKSAFEAFKQLQSETDAMQQVALNDIALQRQQGMANQLGGILGGFNSAHSNQISHINASTLSQLQAQLQAQLAQQQAQVQAAPKVTAASLNEDPVYGPSLAMLRDLWTARWGDGWSELIVGDGDNGDYWFGVLGRLERAQLIERHPHGKFYRIR